MKMLSSEAFELNEKVKKQELVSSFKFMRVKVRRHGKAGLYRQHTVTHLVTGD